MTRTRLVSLSLFILSIAACGGRSTLHLVQGTDGGLGSIDGGASDGKRDVVPGIDGSGPSNSDAVSDAGATGLPDVIDPDAASLGDGRLPDGARAPDGSPGDGAADSLRDGGQPDLGRPEVLVEVRPDTPPDAPVTLTRIEISPASPITVNVGTPRTITITAIYSDNTTADVTSAATVTSADTSILTVAGATLTGLGTKVATTTITATYQTQKATATVNVNGQNPLVSISIGNVPTTAIAVGATANLSATGVFTDGTKQDVTAQATWASSSTSVAAVGDTSTTKGQVQGVSAGTFTVTATVGSIVGTSASMTVSAKKLTSIAITPSNPTLQRGLTNQVFTATGTYDDNSTGDVTQQATWSSSNTAIVTVVATGANAGRVTAVAQGTATITATVGSISGTDQVTVTPSALRSITITGPSVLIVGSPQSYTAMGTYADNTTADLTASVTWSSSDNNVLTASNAAGSVGVASGVAAGNATLRAASGNVTGQLRVTVSAAPLISITLSPAILDNVIVGLTGTFKATGLYGDASNVNTQFSIDVTASATWTVADSTIATVGNTTDTAGQVTGVAEGNTTVTATLSGKSAQATVKVIKANLVSIAISPATASVRVGKTYPFTATGTFDNGSTRDITTDVTWSSGAAATATISNAAGSEGVATGVAASTTPVTITAAMSSKTATASLTVTEARIVSIQIAPAAAQSINTGATAAYTVAAVYENGTTANLTTGVTWTSSDKAVATITANGGGGGPFPGRGGATATGVAKGTTTITASYTTADGTALSDSVTLNVQTPAKIVAIRLTPASATIKVGETQTYAVDADYDNGTTAAVAGATLTSSNGLVASVGGGGPFGGGGLTVTGQAQGVATITASYTTGGQTFTDTASLTVNPASTVTGLYIEPASASVIVNGTQQFRAWTQNSDGTTTDVTANAGTAWSTSDGTLATVTTGGGGGGRGGIFTPGGGGLATGIAVGKVTITAIYTPASGSAVSATATLTVTNPVPKALLISPSSASILLNGTQPFVATLVYADGSSTTVTGQASWTTSDPSVVVMTNPATGGRGGGPGGGGILGGGTATAVGVGSATVTATYTPPNSTTALTATATVTVTDPPVLSLEITPTNPTVYLSSGTTQQFTATVIFTDFSTRNVTTSAQWTSSAGDVAVISNAAGSAGRATGRSVGTTTITASYTGNGGTVTASTVLTVADRKITAVQVTPTNPTTHLGINQTFVATAVYDNGTTATVTGSATWTSSDTSVANVTNGGGGGGGAGVATPVKAGSATITATFGGIAGTSVLTVDSGTLSSIAITPAPLTVAVGAHQQLTATGTYSTGTTQDLTNNVTWLSTDSFATVSNAGGSHGLLTAVSAGTAAVSAKFQGVTGTLNVTVSSTVATPDAGVTD